MKKILFPVITVLIILAAALVGITSLMRPQLLEVDAEANLFSAARAMEHVKEIAKRPHPPGSAEIDRVREYIISELESLQVSYHIQDEAMAITRGSSIIATSVKNIVARIPGVNPDGAILLGSHYDTRAMTPGASDNSSAIAVVLETVRALSEGPGLQNDIILLFTDNEEYGGALGAAAFLEYHPWSEEVDVVLNFEGLGSTGPSVMFETSPDSGRLVKDWAQAAKYPVGQSWFHDIYTMTPISTDLTWFSDAGVPGLNFAPWAKSTAYHTALDTMDNLDPRSVQHTGSYALALTSKLGQKNLSTLRGGGDAVYFTLFRGVMIRYPTSWAIPLSVVAGLLILGAGYFGIKRNRTTLRGITRGLLWSFLAVVASAGLATGIWMAIGGMHELYKAMFTFRGMVYNATLYLVAFAAMTVGIAAIAVIVSRKKSNIRDFTLGVTLFLWIMSIATSILFPGFSYLFTWPALFMALAVAWTLFRPESDRDSIRLTVGAVPGVMLTIPAIYVMFHFAPAMMIGAIIFLMAVLACLLAPVWNMLTTQKRWFLPVVSAGIFILFILFGSLTGKQSSDRTLPNGVAYLQNEDETTGTWFSAGTVRDEWTASFTGHDSELTSVGKLFPITSNAEWFPVLAAAGTYASIPGPTLEVRQDSVVDGIRRVKLLLRSRRQAPVITLELQPRTAVKTADVAGLNFKTTGSGNLWRLIYYTVPSDGILLDFELDPTQPVVLQLSDQSWEIDPLALKTVAGGERSTDMMAMPNFDYGTVVVGTHQLP